MAEKEEKEGVRKKIQRARNVFTRLNKMFRDGPVIKTALSGKIDTNFTKASLGHLLNRNIYNSSTFFNQGFDRMCLDLDTKIPVPGIKKGISLKELIKKYPNGEKFIVYAYNHNEGRVVPALAHHPRSSGIKDTVKVTFDDGTYLICTPDHPCMMRDGIYTDAENLKENDSMMPFYRKNNKIGYPIINTMYNGSKWITEHKLIVEWDTGNKVEKGNIIHHKDFNKSNNNPDNLKVMDAKEHAQYHCDLNSKNKLGVPNPKQTQHMLLNNPGTRNDITFDKIVAIAKHTDYCLGSLRKYFNTNSETIKKRLYEHGYFTWVDFVLKFKNGVETQSEKLKYKVSKSISYQDIIDNIYKCRSKPELAAILKCSIQSINRRLSANGYTWTEFVKKYPKKDRRYVSGKNGYTNSSWNNAGKDNPRFDHEITFDKITEAYEDNMSVWDLVSKLNSTYYKVLKRIKMEGFSNFMEWSDSFNNHKVVSVKPYGKCEVGDLTVDGYENFATESIIVHNSRYSDFSEMEYYPELNAALNLFADESITYDERGNVLKIITENDKIKSLLETLFYDTLNVEFNAWSWVRSLCKWGDFFLLNMVDPEYGVVGVLPIPVQEVEREEGYDPSSPMAVRYRWATQNKILNNWQITHFRLLGNDTFAPYGTSVLEGARRIYRQLTLLEDAVMVYRIVRCLHGETKLWTESGYKCIKDINIGDKVYSYNKDNNLELSSVTDWVNNGEQQIWQVRSKHRTIKGNFNHPILVRDSKTNETDYICISELIPKRHQLVMPILEIQEQEKIPIKLNEDNYEWFGVLAEEGKKHFRDSKFKNSKRSMERKLSGMLTYSESRIHQFLYKDKSVGMPYNIAMNVCEYLEIPLNHLIKYPKGMFNLNRTENIPEFINEEFAEFFGFMVGDGFMSKEMSRLGFATGVREHRNKYYFDIFKKYCSSAIYRHDERNPNPILGKVSASSSYFCHLMRDMGFTTSVYTKTIPGWVFRSSDKIKEKFIDGLMDADGHRRKQRNTESMEIELCNKEIVDSLKELCHQLGWNVSSKVTKRIKPPGRFINGSPVKETTSYSLYVTKVKTGLHEDIFEVSQTDETSDVFDIRVDNESHNFIADGCVVHNSPERRVFKIDVGNIAPDEVPAFMEKIESQIKRDQVVDSSSGRIDLRYNAMSVENDYFIPVRGDMSSEIETLAGGVYTGDVSDIEYFQKKLFAALQIPRAYLGFEDSIGKCLHPDTKIPLLNGVELTIKEIAQIISSGNTQSLWTYSYDKWLNKIVPSKIIAAKQTRQNAELVRVHLDNGKYVDATPDHKFVLRGGESKQAQDLVVGESLQTVNRRMNKMTATSNEYEQVFQPDKGKWEYTHKMVDRLSNGKIIKNGYDNDGRFKGGNIIVVHHKDFNRFNNNPENLQRMKIYEHIKLHSENLHLGWLRPDVVARVKATNRLPENRKKRSEAQKARIRKNPELGMKVLESWMSLTFEERSEICKKAWTPEKKQKRSEQNVEMGLANIMMKAYKKKFPNGRPDLHRENSVVWVERPTFDYVVNFINNYEGDISEINTTPKLAKALGCSFHVFEDAIKTWNWNEVEFLNEHTGFVPGRRKSLRPDYFFEISSNYETKKAFMEANDIGQKALLSLLNHCNISENDWRENYLGSCFNHKVVRVEKLDERVDTYNMEVDDINHHGVHNFYTSAGVVVNNSGLAAEDVRWSRSVQRIQRIIVSEFTKLAIIHLYVHGYEGEDLIDFELRLTNPSNIAEQQKLDLWRTRFEIASSIPEGYFDREFVQKNIFQLSNREIAIIKHKRIEDKKADMELESMSLPGEPEVGGAGGGGFGGAGGFGEEEGGLFGGEGGGEEELFGAEDEELPDEEVSGAGGEETVGGGGLFSHKEMTGNILLEEELEKEINSIDDKDDDKDDDKEPRVRDQEYRFKHNRQRIKRDGPSSLEMPDLDNIANLNTVNSRKNRKKEYDTISDLSIGEKAIKKVDFEISSLLSGLSDAMPKKRKTLTENEDE